MNPALSLGPILFTLINVCYYWTGKLRHENAKILGSNPWLAVIEYYVPRQVLA